MTIYQKAIKVRKECETTEQCYNNNWSCPYKDYCYNSNIVFRIPSLSNIKEIAKAIVIEKWNVK